MRIETAIRIHAGVEHEAEIIAMRENAVHKGPSKLAEFFLAFGVPKEIFPFLADRDVGVHAVAIYTHYRLGQERRGQAHSGGHLAADQFVDLDLVGGGNNLTIAVIDFKLRWRNLRVVFFILETHGALDFRRGVNKCAQQIARKRMVVAAGVHIFELAGFVVATFSVSALKEEALNFIGGVERVAFLLVHLLGKNFERAANIGAVRRAALVDDFTKDQDFAGAENVRWRPIERAPVQPEAKIAFALGGKAANG